MNKRIAHRHAVLSTKNFVTVGESVLEAILTLVSQCAPDQSDDETIRKTVRLGPRPACRNRPLMARRTRAKALIEGAFALIR